MARYDVSPHLSKWWKGVRPDDGQVSELNYFAKKFMGELFNGRRRSEGGEELSLAIMRGNDEAVN